MIWSKQDNSPLRYDWDTVEAQHGKPSWSLFELIYYFLDLVKKDIQFSWWCGCVIHRNKILKLYPYYPNQSYFPIKMNKLQNYHVYFNNSSLGKNSWIDFEIPKVFEIILEWQHIFILSDMHFFYTRQFIFGFL